VRRGVLVGTAAAAVLGVPAPAAHADPPHPPSDTQIARAQQVRQQRAAEVGRLSAALAVQKGEMQRLADAAEAAVERYDKARADLQDATARADRARAAVGMAARRVGAARQDLRRFARGSYVEGILLGPTTSLLVPGGPRDLIRRLDYLTLASRQRLDVVGRMVRAKAARANAESAARAAVLARKSTADAARQAKTAAAHRLALARAQIARLQRQTAATQRQLASAQARLHELVSERDRYRAWQRQQQLAAQRQRALAARLQQAAHARPAPQPFGPGWSPAKGQAVAYAALRWVGTPYAWGGGDADGPTLGEPPDEGVRGFDCSGLALWAWAQVGVRLPHYSGYQYNSGSHVSRADLRPGDLVFWATDGTPGTIHHVAIYLGAGQVVQAPQSGDVVKVSPLWFDGFVGATRPGT
jgi:peptidoglycan DL-endopeptidase RipA